LDGVLAEFSALVTGPLSYSYQWQKKKGSGAWTNIAGAIASGYSFMTSTPDDGTLYRALVSDGVVTGASNPISLSVNPAPPAGLSLSFANSTVIEGQTVTVSVTNTLGTPPFSYQ
ncbi:hypothetical protein RZS08_52910, partial [Arthrospira platensis SPKY1]|nr:hypothetical protein [Arthrospira platensis SPKY1]